MNTEIGCETFLTRLRAEHRHFDSHVLQVRRAFQDAVHAPAGENRRESVVAALKSLREVLSTHFRHEEDEGCLWEAASFNRTLGNDVKQVLAEHPALLDSLEGIHNKVAAEDGGGLEAAEAEFQQLAHRLLEHERREALILEKSPTEA